MKISPIVFGFSLCALGAMVHADPPPLPVPGSSVPGVYKAYVAPPAKTPTPVPGAIDVARVSVHHDTISVIFEGGLASQLGEDAKLHKGGFDGGLQLFYSASDDLGVSFFTQYDSVPYNLTTAAKPLVSLGFGLRAVYQPFEFGQLKPFVEGGLGLYMVNRAIQTPTGTKDANNNEIYTTTYGQGLGLGFSGGLGANYYFTPKFGLRAVVDVTSISLNGGTGDSVLCANPNIGAIYTF